MLYDVNFEVINMDLDRIFHAINWINSLPCWINTHGAFYIVVQVSILFLHVIDFI